MGNWSHVTLQVDTSKEQKEIEEFLEDWNPWSTKSPLKWHVLADEDFCVLFGMANYWGYLEAASYAKALSQELQCEVSLLYHRECDNDVSAGCWWYGKHLGGRRSNG